MATPADLSAGGRNHPRVEPHTSAASLAGDVRVRRRGRRDIVGAGRAALATLSRDTTGPRRQEETPWARPLSNGSPPRRPSAPTTGRMRSRPTAGPSPSSGTTTATGRSSSWTWAAANPCASAIWTIPAGARCSRPTVVRCTSPRTTVAPSASTSTATTSPPAHSRTSFPARRTSHRSPTSTSRRTARASP